MRHTIKPFPARRIALCALLLAPLAGSVARAGVVDNPSLRAMGIVIIWGADAAGSAGAAPVVSDFVIDTGTGNTATSSGDLDLIAGDVHTVVTGTLTPVAAAGTGANGSPLRLRIPGPDIITDSENDGVLDARDTFDAFTINNNADVDTFRAEIWSSFYVASNTAFSIDAQAAPTGPTTPAEFNNIRLRVRVTPNGNDGLAFGSAAQFPHSTGATGGGVPNNRRLSNYETPARVFRGNQATALTRGSIADQSVRFDLRYRFNTGTYDLSEGVIDAAAEVTYTVYVP